MFIGQYVAKPSFTDSRVAVPCILWMRGVGGGNDGLLVVWQT